jgi:prepilin-type N-terminal cleavage/methylation domain-containing protein
MMRNNTRHDAVRSTSGRGFTLTELIVAIAAVSIITLGIAKVFQTAGNTIGAGRAVAELDSTAHAIEQAMKEDLANVADDVFMVIRHRNIATPSGQRRADDIAFFARGDFPTAQYASSGVAINEYARMARIYWGHGLSIGPITSDDLDDTSGPAVFNAIAPNLLGVAGGRNADPQQWTLIRQPLLLRDDDSGREKIDSIFNPYDNPSSGDAVLASGKVDMADCGEEEIRTFIVTGSDRDSPPYNSIANAVGGVIYKHAYQSLVHRMALALPHVPVPSPESTAGAWHSLGAGIRAELAPPSTSRDDMMLTHATFAAGVTSLRFSWSYDGREWYDLGTNLPTSDSFGPSAYYPYPVSDIYGRPILSGLGVPVHRMAIDGSYGASRERVYGFGYADPTYVQAAASGFETGWRRRGVDSQFVVERTGSDNLDPALFDPANPDYVEVLNSSEANTVLPESLAVPFPRFINVRLTLSDSSGEYIDIPYSFTLEIPQPAPTRPVGQRLKDGFTGFEGFGN